MSVSQRGGHFLLLISFASLFFFIFIIDLHKVGWYCYIWAWKHIKMITVVFIFWLCSGLPTFFIFAEVGFCPVDSGQKGKVCPPRKDLSNFCLHSQKISQASCWGWDRWGLRGEVEISWGGNCRKCGSRLLGRCNCAKWGKCRLRKDWATMVMSSGGTLRDTGSRMQ